jgi:ketosteroid isomerase-like protein
MRRSHALCTAVILAALAQCTRPPAVDVGAEEQAVRAASATWLKAVQARDWAAAAAHLAPDGMLFPEHSEPVIGPAAAQAFDEAAWAALPHDTLRWSTDAVVVAASGDLAYELGRWTMAGAGQGDRGRYVTVWRKLNGVWKAAADMGVSTMPVVDSAGT